METNIKGEFYDNVILQINIPVIADVSAADYTAEIFDKQGRQTGTDSSLKQRPFVVSHPKSLKMKVQTWQGKDITWIFDAGKDPIPLKKIYKTPVPLVVENGDVTTTEVTSIQIGY